MTMVWLYRDGSHEGGVGVLLRTGSTDWGGLGQRLTLDALSDVRLQSDRLDRHRTEAVGWVAGCVCGWQGSPWFRTVDVVDAHYPSRVAASRDGSVPREVEDGPMAQEWSAHVPAREALDEITRRTLQRSEIDAAIGAAVARARREGVTWTQIGRAVGTTRQAAQQRWAR